MAGNAASRTFVIDVDHTPAMPPLFVRTASVVDPSPAPQWQLSMPVGSTGAPTAVVNSVVHDATDTDVTYEYRLVKGSDDSVADKWHALGEAGFFVTPVVDAVYVASQC